MVNSLFHKLFPLPRYLERRATGIDISDRSIKYCDLTPDGKQFKLERFGEIPLPVGVVESGQVKNRPALVEALAKLRSQLGVVYVAMALPEEPAFVVKLTLPAMPRANLRSSIELQLEEHVPLPADSLAFDYDIVRCPTPTRNDYDLIVSVFPKAIMTDYLEATIAAGLVPTSFEIEAQAIARALIPREEVRPSLVVDFGKTRTGFFVVSEGKVMATSTVASVGGEMVTATIQKNLGLSYEAAESLKIERGILQSRSNSLLLFALIPIISVLRDEINKFASYWDTHGEVGSGDKRLNKIILCGGQSTLPGLVEYLSSSLGIKVELGNVWANITPKQTKVPPIKFNDSFKYVASLGLALKSFDHHD
jgi:type IV pilus assembly protein PilM